MKSSKRLFSLLLALIMVLSLLPTSALAEEPTDPAPAEEPIEEPAPAEEPVGDDAPDLPSDEPAPADADPDVPTDDPEAEPDPADEPASGSVTVMLRVWTCDADGQYYSEGSTGGTAKLSVNGGAAQATTITADPGDVITVVPSPASGYEVHNVGYSNAMTPLGWLSDTLQLTLPADQTWIEMDVTFAPIGTVLRVGDGTFGIRWPAAGGSYSGPVPANAIASASRPFSVYSAYWYGGADSGSQGKPPASFQPGRHYYAEIELAPLAKFCFTETSSFFANFFLDDSSDFESDLNGTCTYDSATGRLRITTGEMQYPGDVRLRVFTYGCQSDGSLLEESGGTVKLSVNGAAPVEAGELMVCGGDTINISAEPGSGFALQTAQWGDGDDLLGVVTDTLSFTIPSEGKYFELVVYFVRTGEPVTLRLFQYTHGDDLYLVSGTVQFRVNGGAAQTMPASNELTVLPGDQISLVVTPYAGYRLQSASWGSGDEFAGDITETLAFTVPEDCSVCEVIVYFAPANAVIPISSVTVDLTLPLPAGSYSAGATQAEYGGLENFDIVQTFWYGGTGSGCQDAFPSSFISGASYYARIWLAPKDNWRFEEGTQVRIRLENGSLVEAKSTYLDPDNGTFLIETNEYPIYTRDILQASVELEMFEEGGSYTDAVPAVVTAPEGAHYSVSDAYWYNYDSQESGGVGIAPGFFSRDGRYFVSFTLVPDEGYTFQQTTQVTINPGRWENIYRNSDGSLSVSTSWYSLDEETAALRRRVRITNQIMNADGSLASSGGNYVVVNDYRPLVGDTLTIDPVPKSGYHLQWVTISRYSELIGEDYTESLQYTVTDEPGDVYIWALFAADDEPVEISTAGLYLHYPSPGGSYSGAVPANATVDYFDSQVTIQSTRWYLLTDGLPSDPTSFVAGNTYAAEIVLAPKEGWVFTGAPGVVAIELDDGSRQFLPADGGQVSLMPDGTVIVTTAPITLPRVQIDKVELSMRMPVAGESYAQYPDPAATVYTPSCVGPWYTVWRNAQDQATGAAGEVPTGFEAGCVYHGTIRIGADTGYDLTPDTQVILLNDVPYKATYHSLDHSFFINIDNYVIPGESYRLIGSDIDFYVNGALSSTAHPGDYVQVHSKASALPAGKYMSAPVSSDVEFTQLTLELWGFTMPAKDVTVNAQLKDQETYVFELEDGVHYLSAEDAAQLYGPRETGTDVDYDLDGDGVDDLWLVFYEDGTARAVRTGNIYGDLTVEVNMNRIGTVIYRFGPERYSVWLGGVQVTAANKNNIPVQGGTAKYDPATHTLTLTDVTGVNDLLGHSSSMVGSYFILSTYDLTVKGSANLESDYRGGVYCGGSLTLDGDFGFYSEFGVWVEGNLDATGVLRVYAKDIYAVYVGGNAVLMDCKTFLQNSEGQGLVCSGNIAVSGEFSVNAIECGVNCGIVFNFVDGYLYVISSKDIAVQVNGPLNIMNGFFGASGNVQAIQVSDIRIPGTHTIEKPTNGVISSDRSTITDPSTNAPAKQVWINGQSITIELGVKDLDGNEGVGGTVAFNNGSYATEQTGSFALNTEITIRAQADNGYDFDHWETSYGGFCSDEQFWKKSFAFAENPKYYAVFEELLPIDAAHFPDAKFRSYISSNIDGDGDGWLSRAERNAVTGLNLSEKEIGSLVGIKYFPELTWLRCEDNNLTQLDLRQNTKLQSVYCHFNANLKYLFVNGCTELKILACYDCSLTSLNLAGCSKLQKLQCQNNNIYRLELGHCCSLQLLQCLNNPSLSKLALNSDVLYQLLCYGTKINALDLSACRLMNMTYRTGTYTAMTLSGVAVDSYALTEGSTSCLLRFNSGAAINEDLGIPINAHNFPDPLFRKDVAAAYDANGNGWLSPTEIANTTSFGFEDEDFYSVQGIEFFTEMTSLLLDGAPNLTSIDLRSNTKLQYVDVCANQLSEIKLDGLTELKSLAVDSNRLTELDVSAFPLEELWVYNNPMTSLTLGEQPNLNKLYAHWTELAQLDLSGCPLLLDAYLNGEQTLVENAEKGNYIKYVGPKGGLLYLDADQAVFTHVPGDVNGDGKVSNKDVTALQRYIKYKDITVNIASLDVNGDGKVSNKDVTALQRWIKYKDVTIH